MIVGRNWLAQPLLRSESGIDLIDPCETDVVTNKRPGGRSRMGEVDEGSKWIKGPRHTHEADERQTDRHESGWRRTCNDKEREDKHKEPVEE